MKSLLRVSLFACLLLILPVVASAQTAAPADAPAVNAETVAPCDGQAGETSPSAPAPAILPALSGVLSDVQFTACTCSGQASACATKCDICPDCYGDFTCNVSNPCQSRCICRVLNP